MKSYWSLVRARAAFRNLWLAQIVSMTGDWFNTIASVILVNRYLNSGLAVGGLLLARTLPPFFFGPLAGVFADRFNRRVILIVSDLLRAVIVLGYLWVDRPERAWLLFVLSVVQFSVSAFFEPARAALLPNVVAGDELIPANTLSSATWSAMLAFGAAIGGLTAAVFGTRLALMIDSASFLGSALFVFFGVSYSPRPSVHGVRPGGLADFLAGLAYVRQRPKVGLTALVKALGQVGSMDIVAALFAARVFPYGEGGALTLGLIFAAFGLGAVAGPVIANRLGVRGVRSLQVAINMGFVFVPIGWFLMGAAPVLPLALAGVFLRGVGGSINWTYSDVLLQMSTEDRFMGRVYSLDIGIYTLALSLSVWLSGAAVDRFGLDPRAVTFYFALGSLLPLVIWTLATQAVKMDQAMAVRGN